MPCRRSVPLVSLQAFVFLALLSLLPTRHHALVHKSSRSFVASRRSSTQLYVFEFFRQKSQEGFNQLNTLVDANYRGQLGTGLLSVADYISQSNKAFADGLAKSRTVFLQNLESIFTGVSPDDVMEDLEDILLQADVGTVTAQDIVREVKSLQADSTEMLSRQDLMSVLRGKLIEALSIADKPTRIQFADPAVQQPTVLFVMGAVSAFSFRARSC